MRVVIDSNRIQTDELAQFLTRSPSNKAVITDWLMIEAYKGDTLSSIFRSLDVVSRFPKQVLVLKNTGMCMKTAIGSPMARRLIWNEHTENFPQFVLEVQSAQQGNVIMTETLIERGKLANDRMEVLLSATDGFLKQNQTMQADFSQDDIDAIRGRRAGSSKLVARIMYLALSLGNELADSLAVRKLDIEDKNLSKRFLFRFCLASLCSFLEWVRTGSQNSIKPEKIRNDYVDAIFSAYGSYFNGIMTGDNKLKLIHSINIALLQALGTRLPPQYPNR